MRDPRLIVAVGRLGIAFAMVGCEAEQAPAEAPSPAPVEGSAADPSPLDRPSVDGLAGPSFGAWADWPVENVAPRTWFGWRLEPSGQYTHSPGLGFALSSNSYVLAIADGRVQAIQVRPDGSTEVVVIHENGLESRYRPLSASLVYAGMPVARGTALGIVDSGELTLEVWSGGTPVDPLASFASGF